MRELRVRAEKLLVRSDAAHAWCSKWLYTLGWCCFAVLGTYVEVLHTEAHAVAFGSFL